MDVPSRKVDIVFYLLIIVHDRTFYLASSYYFTHGVLERLHCYHRTCSSPTLCLRHNTYRSAD